MPGESRGTLKPEVKEELGLEYDVEVIAVASHDTASAVYAVPPAAGGEVTAFLSSGTWSLLGVLTDVPILSEEARMNGFTNEGGAEGKICFLQNITGLWILRKLDNVPIMMYLFPLRKRRSSLPLSMWMTRSSPVR